MDEAGLDGYPLILVFWDLRVGVAGSFRGELAVQYGKLVTISVDPPWYRAFVCGSGGAMALCPMKTGADQAVNSGRNRGECLSRPALFVLRPDLTIYKIYNGWFSWATTIEELQRTRLWKPVGLSL